LTQSPFGNVLFFTGQESLWALFFALLAGAITGIDPHLVFRDAQSFFDGIKHCNNGVNADTFGIVAIM